MNETLETSDWMEPQLQTQYYLRKFDKDRSKIRQVLNSSFYSRDHINMNCNHLSELIAVSKVAT